ncbi:hypothetical protein BC936DRAFT_149636 [Jimgerdemannia flammicorona]|uniref:CCHC-type domain-containing protein n=1 Tax=Jimgerdemannia flammicorona TaxID=994334 RepID=A0A433DJV2_9FUNG|nr:hypothetical protein BC936DRAFT_149636 [Jimgerdemannia flammicorona]
MTRYTKLSRKTHEDPVGFQVTPLNKLNDADSKPTLNGKKRHREETTEQTPAKDGENNATAEGERTKLSKRQRKNIAAQKKKQMLLSDANNENSDASETKGTKSVSETAKRISQEEKAAKRRNQYQFAKCFICNTQGHLSSACPQNEKGLYPKGGSCRFCGKVDHLAKDCRVTKEEVGTIVLGKIDLVQGADDDDFHIFVSEKMRAGEEEKVAVSRVRKAVGKKKRVVKF